MFEFEKKTWYDSLDSRAIPISPSNLNRIEEGVGYSVDGTNSMFGHWWKKSKVVDGTVEYSGSSETKYFYIWSTTDDATVPIYYSSSVSAKIDKTTGKVYAELINPKKWMPSYSSLDISTSGNTKLNGQYFIIGDSSGESLHYCSSAISRRTDSTKAHPYGFSGTMYYLVPSRVYGEVEYVFADSIEAYPNGWSDTDIALYEYLGTPFENSRESCKEVVIGYYIGSGVSNKLIRTEHKPKCIFLYREDAELGYNGLKGVITEMFSYGEYSSLCIINDDGFTVTNGANTKGRKYNYIVFY